MIGKRFSRLLVLERVQKAGSTHIFWRCQCECGNQRIVRNSELYEGTTRHCGCQPRKQHCYTAAEYAK